MFIQIPVLIYQEDHEEKFILDPPSAEASRSALNKHAQTVAKLAKNGDALEINNGD